jgi:hypothetical protein
LLQLDAFDVKLCNLSITTAIYDHYFCFAVGWSNDHELIHGIDFAAVSFEAINQE